MVPDFNKELLGFVGESKAWEGALSSLRSDSAWLEASAEERLWMEEAAEAAFESVVIFRTLAPSHERAAMREPLSALATAQHTPKSLAAMERPTDASGEHGREWVKSFVSLCLARRGLAQVLAQELATRELRDNAMREAAAIGAQAAPGASRSARTPRV